MKESNYKSYDELPLFLNAATVAKVLGIAPSSSYELMHEKDFPALRIGNRIVVPKEAFIRWVEQHTGGELSEAQSLADTRFGQGLLPAAERNFLAGSERGRDRNLRLPSVLRRSADIPMLAKLPKKSVKRLG